jgi:hypothetical protein
MQKTIKLGAYGLIIWQKYEIVKVQKRNLNPHVEAFIGNWNLLFHLSRSFEIFDINRYRI